MAAVRHLLAQVVGIVLVKVHQHLVDGIQRPVGGVELIGVRIEEALQPAGLPQGDVLEEGEGVVVLGGLLLQIADRGHPGILQQLEYLLQGVALRDGHGNFRLGGGVDAHAGQQGPVIHVGVQGVGADGHLVLAAGDVGKQLEQPLELDEAVLFQGVDHVVKAVLRRHGDGDLFILLVQGQHIPGGNPPQTGQHDGHANHAHDIHHGKA